MGLFRLLFGKKSNKPEEIKTEEKAVTEETAAISTSDISEKTVEQKINTAPKQAPPKPKTTKKSVEEPVVADTKAETYDTEKADVLSSDKDAKNVKVKGFGGAFEIKRSKDGRFVFNLYAANRVIVATSQIYSSSQSAITGINSVIANAEKAAIEDQTLKSFVPQSFPKWEIYIDKAGQFRFRLLASNGSCVCHSQGYTQKSTCKKGIESIIRTVKNAEIDKAYLKRQ